MKICLNIFRSFEEMRMRYERRDPRPEDLRQINELKSVVDSQEKDIFYLTEQLRELQLQQQMRNHNIQINQQNDNQSKKNNKAKNNKPNNSNKNLITNNGISDISAQQIRHQTSNSSEQTKENANLERDQQPRPKPPPLIKTIIYEEENENELYEQQIRDERELAKKNQDRVFETELHSQQSGVTVELVPESPDYTTKHKSNMEEISEAHIVSDQDIINDVPNVIVVPAPSSDNKLQEMRIELISTIEPAHIQVVPSSRNGSLLDLEVD